MKYGKFLSNPSGWKPNRIASKQSYVDALKEISEQGRMYMIVDAQKFGRWAGFKETTIKTAIQKAIISFRATLKNPEQWIHYRIKSTGYEALGLKNDGENTIAFVVRIAGENGVATKDIQIIKDSDTIKGNPTNRDYKKIKIFEDNYGKLTPAYRKKLIAVLDRDTMESRNGGLTLLALKAVADSPRQKLIQSLREFPK